jgi:Flp pilus assembly protein TadD
LRQALMLRLRRQEITSDPKGAEQTSESLSKLPEQQLWSAHARVLFSQKKVDGGIAEYQRALKEHGDAVSLRNDYAGSLIAAGRDKDAMAVVAGTLKDHPKDPAALLEQALEISTGSLDAATHDIKTLRCMKRVSAELSFQESRICAARDCAEAGPAVSRQNRSGTVI